MAPGNVHESTVFFFMTERRMISALQGGMMIGGVVELAHGGRQS
jgi:hypothetical protein